MSKSKLIINAIFYIIVTIIFIILFWKEKKISEWVKIHRDQFSDKLITKMGIEGTKIGEGIKKGIALVESIGSAIIIVLIIQKIYLGNFVVPTGSMIPTIELKDRLFGNMVIYNFEQPKREDIIVFKEPINNKVLYTKRIMGLPGEKVEIKNNHLYVNDKEITTREYSALGALGVADYWRIPKVGDTVEVIPGHNYQNYMEQKNIDIEEIQKNIESAAPILNDITFKVNGEPSGMILDIIHNKKYLEKLLNGEPITVKLDSNYYLALGDNTNGSFDSRMWGFVKEDRIKGKIFFRFWPLNRISFVK